MRVELELGLVTRTQPVSPPSLAAYRFYRHLVGGLKRVLRWEFWPPYLFYPPVIAYIAYLGLRFRSFTLFTASNPGMPAGGFVGESKHEILGHLKNGHLKNAASFLPFSLLLPGGTRDRFAGKNSVYLVHARGEVIVFGGLNSAPLKTADASSTIPLTRFRDRHLSS